MRRTGFDPGAAKRAFKDEDPDPRQGYCRDVPMAAPLGDALSFGLGKHLKDDGFPDNDIGDFAVLSTLLAVTKRWCKTARRDLNPVTEVFTRLHLAGTSARYRRRGVRSALSAGQFCSA